MSARTDYNYYLEYKRKCRGNYYQQEEKPEHRVMKTPAARRKEYRLRQNLKLQRQISNVAKRPSNFLPDVDGNVLVPSPKRKRNSLTLEERMQAIQAYDCRQVYSKVAKMFHCGWEQIKNIIANRESIKALYNANKKFEKKVEALLDDVKQKKIAFLGECMYEFIQRAQVHTNADLTDEMILQKATEFRDIILIDKFTPNKGWINNFKATYDFSVTNTRTPPVSLELSDILTFCIKKKSKGNEVVQQAVYGRPTAHNLNNPNDATFIEMRQRRQRKITFLETALFEYIQRWTFHHKTVLDDETLRKVAFGIKDVLEIENFFPNTQWVIHFRDRYAFRNTQRNRKPPLSLDLADILSYCSKNELQNNPPQTTVMIKPMLSMHSLTLEGSTNSLSGGLTQQPKVKEETIELDVRESDDELRPSIPNFLLGSDSDSDDGLPPLKIRTIATMLENGSHYETIQSHWSANPFPEEPQHELEDEPAPATALVTTHPTKKLRTYQDALDYLISLEEFAMLKENYRAIGLISQLEETLKNSAKLKTDAYNAETSSYH